MEKKLIVSLGRQFGSGGRQVGRMLADALGISYYDRELIAEMARQNGMAEDYVAESDERAPGFFDYATFGRLGATHLFGRSQNFVMLGDTLRSIAARGSCLIVGRTSDYILRHEPGLIKLFVHAPRSYRILSVARRMNISAEEAEALVTRHDKERARFYDFFTDKTWGQADSYDLSVDVARLGVDETVAMLADYVKRRVAHLA